MPGAESLMSITPAVSGRRRAAWCSLAARSSATNQPELISQAKPQIEDALPLITDYELVLDLSRQVLYSELGRNFALQIFQRGQQLGQQAFTDASNPALAARILFKLCRRANDLDQYDSMIATWTNLTAAKRQWMWQEQAEYWDWLELVFRAYRDSNHLREGEEFVTPLLNDSATPPQGYAILGVSYSAMKRNQGDFATMFSVHEKMAQVAPTHEWTSAAYYWLALRSWRHGNTDTAASYADKLLVALGTNWTLLWKREMAASASYIKAVKAGIDMSQLQDQQNMPATVVREQMNVVLNDLNRLTM